MYSATSTVHGASTGIVNENGAWECESESAPQLVEEEVVTESESVIHPSTPTSPRPRSPRVKPLAPVARDCSSGSVNDLCRSESARECVMARSRTRTH